MKKLVATAPRVAALVEYEDRAILSNEVKIRVRFGAPKHGTEVVDFRAASPFIDEDFNGEWQMFTPRPADAPRGIEFGKFQLGNMVVGDIIECGSDVTGAVATVVFPSVLAGLRITGHARRAAYCDSNFCARFTAFERAAYIRG
ncbi:zinc-type alcohol dehydrogenase-like protein YcjQ [Escherichia coli]|nr:zinc-type alcohol dehydrogenase-like protein YcjQ [Escherichia coli]SRA79604.1 zinc-type alcohol dehydrogenase-like protein YcjQ [Escherichia coli]